MKPGRFPARSVAALHVALALLVQFAPSIHLSTPHQHDTTACTHGSARVHVEASIPDRDNGPCPVCTNLLNRAVLVEFLSARCERTITTAAKAPTPVYHQNAPALHHPDSRGPPQAL